MSILFDFLRPTPADSFDERPGPSRWAELMNLTRAAGPPASVEWLPAEIKRRTLFELYSKPSPALAHLAPSPPWPEPLSSQSSNLSEMTSRQATDSWEGVNSPLKQSNSLPGLSDTIPFARRYLRTMNSGLGSIAGDLVPDTRLLWHGGPPDHLWAPSQSQTIEGRETGPSDSWGSVELPRSAATGAWPASDRAGVSGPSFSDWLLASAARPPANSMRPFGLAWESVPPWPPQARSEDRSAFPPAQGFGDVSFEPYRALTPLHSTDDGMGTAGTQFITERQNPTGPSFSDWLLPSAAKPAASLMTPFGLPPESQPSWPPPVSGEHRSASPPMQGFGDETIEAYRALRPLRRPLASADGEQEQRESAIGRWFREGFNSAIRDLSQVPGAITGNRTLDTRIEPDLPEAKDVEWSDFADPFTKLAPKMAYRFAKNSPTLAGGVVGGGVGFTAGSMGGPFGEAVGTVGGAALGTGAMSAAMSLGPYYQRALRETDDPELAFNSALRNAALDGVITSATVTAFAYAPFSSFVKNLLFQGLAIQPGLSVAAKAVKNVAAGRPAREDLGAGIPGAIADAFLAFPALHGLGKWAAGAKARTRSFLPESADPGAVATVEPLPPAVRRDGSPKAQLELFDPSETGERGQLSPPKLPPYRGGHTMGSFHSPTLNVMIRSGYDGPTSLMPKGSPGLDIVTKTHVEAHAAALMRQHGIREATLYINNPDSCPFCIKYVPRMLPSESVLHVILPNGTVVTFKGAR